MSLSFQLTKITRTGFNSWETKKIIAVSFAPLVLPKQRDNSKPRAVPLRKYHFSLLTRKAMVHTVLGNFKQNSKLPVFPMVMTFLCFFLD